MVGPLEGFADVWGSTFLRTVYGMDSATAANLPSTIFIGMCVGGPLLSIIARKSGNDIGVIFVCGLVMMFTFAGLLMSFFDASLLPFVFFIVGIACGYQIIAIAYASTRVPEAQMGLTSALANMIIMTFGYVFHAVIGGVIGYFSDGEIDIEAVSSDALTLGIAVIPAALALSAMGFFIMAIRRRDSSHAI